MIYHSEGSHGEKENHKHDESLKRTAPHVWETFFKRFMALFDSRHVRKRMKMCVWRICDVLVTEVEDANTCW